MNAWLQYLHRVHSHDELRSWAHRLRYFRFCRAYGGHANDGDRLLVAFAHEGQADALRLCAQLDPSVYRTGLALIGGVSVLVVISAHQLTLTISGADGNPYEVTARDVDNALVVEVQLAPLAQRIIDPPIDTQHCIAPATAPEFWEK